MARRVSRPCFWKQSQRADMSWTKQPKVASIECREFRLAKTLGNREHGGVDEADVCVGILIAELANTAIVLRTEVDYLVRAGIQIVKQCETHARVQALVNRVVHLDHDGRRNDERFVRRLNKLFAATVRGIIAVERGTQRPRVRSWTCPYRQLMAQQQVLELEAGLGFASARSCCGSSPNCRAGGCPGIKSPALEADGRISVPKCGTLMGTMSCDNRLSGAARIKGELLSGHRRQHPVEPAYRGPGLRLPQGRGRLDVRCQRHTADASQRPKFSGAVRPWWYRCRSAATLRIWRRSRSRTRRLIS